MEEMQSDKPESDSGLETDKTNTPTPAKVSPEPSGEAPRTNTHAVTSQSPRYLLTRLFPPSLIPVLTLFVLVTQVLVYLRQANIMERQSSISDFQAKLLERQTTVAEDQRRMAIRPTIQTEVKVDTTTFAAKAWIIHNKGHDRVRSLRLASLHFTKLGPGWRVISSSSASLLPELEGGQSSTQDLSWLAAAVQGTTPKGRTVQGGLEFLILLLYFERDVDGKQYVYLEPFLIERGMAIPQSPTNMSGPLGRICSPEVELVYEFFRRRAFETPIEIYNRSYVLGYSATGCLGPITWVDFR